MSGRRQGRGPEGPREVARLAERLSSGSRILGLDLGTKTIGLALSDVGLAVASPYDTIFRTRFARDSRCLAGIIGKEGVGGLIIGLPMSMDGTEGPRCRSTRRFARTLALALADLGLGDVPMAFWDERLSTAAVERVLIEEADVSRRRRARLVDKLAAAYILQGALDALANRRLRPECARSLSE